MADRASSRPARSRRCAPATVRLGAEAMKRCSSGKPALGPRGEQQSPLELEEVIFGMRCSSAVMFAVIRALEGRDRPVRFYEIRGQHGRFLLNKRVADTDELLATHPLRHRGIFEIFSEF